MEKDGLDALYTVAAEVVGGRQGRARLVGGSATIALAFPAELGGPGAGTGPEQLLAVAFGASLGSTLDLEARQMNLEPAEISVTCTVSLGHGDSGSYALAVELQVRLPGLDLATARRLLRAAAADCPFCRMARGSIALRLALAEPASS